MDAERRKTEAEKARRLSDHSRYALQIGQVLGDLQDGNPTQALDRLGGCDLDLRGWEHDYLTVTCGRLLRNPPDVMEFDEVHAVAVSRDGRHFAAFSAQGRAMRLFLRDAATFRRLLTVEPGHYVEAIAYSEDGTRLFAAGFGRLTTWDVQTGKQASEPRELSRAAHFTFTPDGRRLLESSAQAVVVRDPVTGQEVRRIALPEPLLAGAGAHLLSTAGGRLATTNGSRIRVWDLTHGRQVASWDAGTPGVVALVLRGDGQRLATIRQRPWTGGSGPHVQVWDVPTARVLLTPPVPDNAVVHAVAFTPDGQRLCGTGLFSVASEHNGFAKLWDAETGRELSGLRNIVLLQSSRPVALTDGRILLLSYVGIARLEPRGRRPTHAAVRGAPGPHQLGRCLPARWPGGQHPHQRRLPLGRARRAALRKQ